MSRGKSNEVIAVRRLMLFLKGEQFERSSPVFAKVLEFLKAFPAELSTEERDEFRKVVTKCFSLTEAELKTTLVNIAQDKDKELKVLKEIAQEIFVEPELKLAKSITTSSPRLSSEQDFRDCLPKGGFVEQYINLTANTEPPLIFHIMAMLCICGASLKRQAWIKKGFYNVYPNISPILLAESGKCKKGAAVALANDLLEPGAISKLSEKLTPEVLVEALKQEEVLTGTASGLLYAPELSVLLGKQRYNEGMIPLLNTLIECPNHWSSATITRGEVSLGNVFVSILGASTIDLFHTSMPQSALDGGWVSRVILVPAKATRSVPWPTRDDKLLQVLKEALAAKTAKTYGEMHLCPKCYSHHVDWYNGARGPGIGQLKLAAYMERKPDHLLRIAMVLHILEHDTAEICFSCYMSALKILDYLEVQLPQVFMQFGETRAGEESNKVIDLIDTYGGTIEHTQLIRKLQYRLTSRQIKEHIETLKESGFIKEVKTTLDHYYVLKRKGVED